MFVTSRPHSQEIIHGLCEALKVDHLAQREDIEFYIREKIDNSVWIKGLVLHSLKDRFRVGGVCKGNVSCTA